MRDPLGEPQLYELITDRDSAGSQCLYQLVWDSPQTVSTQLKKVIRWLWARRYVQNDPNVSGCVYRYPTDDPEQEPILLMRFSDSGNYVDLLPIAPHDIDRFEKD